MMKPLEAMKQALDALEDYCEYGAIKQPYVYVNNLKSAIAEMEKAEPVAWMNEDNRTMRGGTASVCFKFYPEYGYTIPLYTHPAPTEMEWQEPVAWRVYPFKYGIGSEGVYALTMREDQVRSWESKGWDVEPLFTHPPGETE